jgi:tellurite resistance protein TerC
MESLGNPLLWTVFGAIVTGMLALDLGLFNREVHETKTKEALAWTIVWVTLALIFNGVIYYFFGRQRALEFLTGYLIEEALSVDNIFVFVVLFRVFAVPKVYQHRVLFWGVFGAIVMRAIFIGAGAALVQRFHWVMYIFGAILVVTGIRLMFGGDDEIEPDKNLIFRLIRRFVPAVSQYHGKQFVIVQNGKRYATPLLIVLLAIEATDLVFAVDSIPAIFAITVDPFIIYTSNIFAIMGLRSLYFLLARVIDRFHLLKIALALVLLFVGAKMLIVHWYKIPIGVSLAVIASLLIGGVVLSFLFPQEAVEPMPPEEPVFPPPGSDVPENEPADSNPESKA